MAPKTRTNAYPTVKPLQDIFASRPSGVTMIGPDKHVWQSGYHDGLPFHTSDNSGNMPFIKPEGIDPRNYLNKYVVGPNQKLLMGYKDSQGQFGWREEKNIMSDNTVGFKLPSSEEVPASLDANAIDDKGIALNIFVGAFASYRRSDALPVYWDGETFFDLDKNELYVPEQFKRGIPTTYGLKGTVYIPQESYLEDLLIPIEDQELSFPAEYHPKESFPSMGVKSDGRHAKTNRKVGFQSAKECFESAWEQAVFEIEDIFTMPGATYRERRAVLETFVKPLKDAYKQIRLIPTMPIHSREWAMSAYENTPPNAYLVITDPDSVFEGAVDPKEKAAPRRRRNLDQNEFAGPLVGWKLDGSGQLEGVVVEGTSTVNKSAIVVHPGQLWVANETDPLTKNPGTVRRQMNEDIKKIRKLRDSFSVKMPADFVNRMVKAYQQDFDMQTRSLRSITEGSYTVNRARAYRTIRGIVGTKLWCFGENNIRVHEYGGVKIDKSFVENVVKYTTEAVFGEKSFYDTGVAAEVIRQLGLFVKLVCTVIVTKDDGFSKINDAIKTEVAAPSANEIYVQRMWNGMSDVEKQKLIDACMELREPSHVKYGKALDIGQKNAAGCFNHITTATIECFLHTDQDPIYPLSETEILTIHKAPLPAFPKNTAATKFIFGTDEYAFNDDGIIMWRALSLDLVGRLIQSIKATDLFVYKEPPAGSALPSKNLLEWSTAQTIYFQRSFPYGALIHFKVVKGDTIDESSKEDDTYAMTKVTVV